MKTFTHTQQVTNYNLDKITDRYITCGWIEKDIIGTSTSITAIVFEWTGDGFPEYPLVDDLL